MVTDFFQDLILITLTKSFQFTFRIELALSSHVLMPLDKEAPVSFFQKHSF